MELALVLGGIVLGALAALPPALALRAQDGSRQDGARNSDVCVSDAGLGGRLKAGSESRERRGAEACGYTGEAHGVGESYAAGNVPADREVPAAGEREGAGRVGGGVGRGIAAAVASFLIVQVVLLVLFFAKRELVVPVGVSAALSYLAIVCIAAYQSLRA